MRRLRAFCQVLPLLAVVGCGQAFEDPPIEISFRESLIGAGKIVQVTNTSNTVLEKVEITIVAPGGDQRSFLQEELRGYATLEVGWKKLGGWQVPAGAEVTVHCNGFLGSVSGTLPAANGEI